MASKNRGYVRFQQNPTLGKRELDEYKDRPASDKKKYEAFMKNLKSSGDRDEISRNVRMIGEHRKKAIKNLQKGSK